MSSLDVKDFDIKRENFKEWYAQTSPALRAAEKTYRNLLRLLISSISTLPPPKIISRLKKRDECVAKFQRKYLSKLDLKEGDYEIQYHVTDIIGIRIICLYESNLDTVADQLKSNFELVSEANKTKELQSQDDKFGYKGQHLNLKLNNKRSNLPEYENLKDFSFEVQIRTIAQDAWSEIDHKLKYKKDLPKHLKRRVYILAGLFELADREFDSLREDTEKLVTAALDKDKQDNTIKESLNSFNFLKLVHEYYSKYNFIEYKIEEFVDSIREVKQNVTINEVEDAMKKHFNTIDQYRDWCLKNIGRNLNPYTEIRHVLYHYNNDDFNDIMFSTAKGRFNDWVRNVFDKKEGLN